MRRSSMMILSLALAASAAVAPPTARADPAGAFQLTLTGPTDVRPNVSYVYTGRLTLAGLVPLPGQNIRIRVDGVLLAGVPTDTDGVYFVTVQFPGDGSHLMRATFLDANPLETNAELDVVATTRADLSLDASAPETVPVDSDFTITVAVQNAGPDEASGVVLTAVVGGPGELVSGFTGDGRDCVFVGVELRCPIAEVPAGQDRGVEIMASATAPGIITFEASVAGAEGDPVPENDAVAVAIQVV